MPETRGAAFRRALAALRGAGTETPGLDARLLLCAACGISHEQFIVHGDALMSADEEAQFTQFIARRLNREPVARIFGEKEFWGLSFKLGADTLVPRPDSECLIDAVLDRLADFHAPLRVLDLGTGTGCLLLALLSELPNASGVGIDVAPGAIEVATENACRFGVEARTQFQLGNWAEGLEGPFDIVLSNPPYIPSAEMKTLSRDVREHDPSRALDGGVDGLDAYREIINQLPPLMAGGAIAAFETAPHVYDPLTELLKQSAGFEGFAPIHDLAGRKRGLTFQKRR